MQVTYQCYVCAVLCVLLLPEVNLTPEGALLLSEVNLTPDGALFQISSLEATAIEPRVSTEGPPLCEFSIWEQSKIFFVARLRQMNPKFIKFGIQFYNGTNVIEHTEPQVLKPKLWFWTYSTAGETYPYLNWNVDFGLLTFGLLDAETIEIPYVDFKAYNTSKCIVNFGANESMINVAKALSELVVNETVNEVHQFEQISFCYLTEIAGAKSGFEYYAGLYLQYPVPFIQYSCCEIIYYYTTSKYSDPVCNVTHDKWTLCFLGPYIVGVMILLFFPIMLFELFHSISKDEVIQSYDYESTNELSCLVYNRQPEAQWVFLDGASPLTLSYLPAKIFAGFKDAHPVLRSRLRRFVNMLLVPVLLFANVFMYRNGIGNDLKITIDDLVKRGTPLGFLAILADTSDARKVFVPALGGPVGVLIIYYTLGVLLLVLPRSLKQIVENGMPSKRAWSPFFLSVDEILRMAMLEPETEPGYHRAAAVCRGSFYMVFNKEFWYRILYMQLCRLVRLKRNNPIMFALTLPVVLLVCALETAACAIFNLFPLANFSVITVKGAVVSLIEQRRHYECIRCCFRTPLIVVAAVICCVLFTMFAYTVMLIFLESFVFISQVAILCFVAVIVFPSVAFGYLFFFVVLLYYLFRLARGFGDTYFELLSMAVEKLQDLDAHVNHVSMQDGTLEISNVRAAGVRSIRVNNVVIDVPHNTLERIKTEQTPKKTRQKANAHGIPRDLFEYLVTKHRPINIQFIRLVFHFALIKTLVVLTMSIISKFKMVTSSESSDVMHVIFIVTVGALPRVLELVLLDGNEMFKRQLEETKIEQSILRYWRNRLESFEDLSLCSHSS